MTERKTQASIVHGMVMEGTLEGETINSIVSQDMVYSLVKIGEEYFKVTVQVTDEEDAVALFGELD